MFCFSDISLLRVYIMFLLKGLLEQLAMFTMNTSRGVLHAKTEGHKYNKMFIPMIGGEFIKQDLAIPLNAQVN